MTKAKQLISWEKGVYKVSNLKPHPLNPRKFTEKGLADLEASIKSIGKAQPLNINKDGVVLSGNARLQVLQKMGIEEIDCYIANRKLTDREEKEVLIRLNKNVAGVFDLDILGSEFVEEDLIEFGFTEEELNIDSIDTDEEFGDSNEEVGNVSGEGKFVFKFVAEEYIKLISRFNRIRKPGETDEALFVRMIKVCEDK